MKNLVLTALGMVLTTSITLASPYGAHANKGVMIFPENESEQVVAKESGESAVLAGKVCAVKLKKNHHNYKCEPFNSEILGVQFFYPDAVTEVTDQVDVVRSDKEISYEFQVDELQSAHSSLIVVVSTKKGNTQVKRLLRLRDKISHHQKHFHRRLSKIRNKEMKNQEEREEWLENGIELLGSIEEKIESTLSQSGNIIARYEKPVQIDNQYTQSLVYESVFNEKKLYFKSLPGSAIEGDRASIDYGIIDFPDKEEFKRLKFKNHHKNDDFEFFSDDEYFLTLNYRDNEVIEVPFQGGDLHQSFETSNLFSNHLHDFSVELYRLKKRGKGKGKGPKKKDIFGLIEVELPLARDIVAPTISDLAPEHQQKIILTLEDSFGRIDFDSIKASLEGITYDEQVLDQNVSSQLNIENIGSDFVNINADFTDFTPGRYVFSLEAKDLAGNSSAIYQKELLIDLFPPEMEFVTADNILTNNNQFTVSFDGFDHSPVRIKLFQNDLLVYEGEVLKDDVLVTLEEGLNTFRLEAGDIYNNISDPIYLNAQLDSIAPTIALNNPLENAVLSINDLKLSGEVSEKLKSFKVLENATLVSEELSFSVQDLNIDEGAQAITLEAIDLAGNVTTLKRNVIIDNTAPNINILSQHGHYTNLSSYSIDLQILDANNVTSKIYFNGSLLETSGLKNLSKVVTLKEGANSFTIEVVDQAGNTAEVASEEIILDTVPATITLNSPLEDAIINIKDLMISGKVSEKLKEFEIQGHKVGLNQDLSFSKNDLNLSEGDQAVTFKAVDLAGNVSTLGRNVTIDNTPPVINILSRHGYDTNNPDYTLELEIEELHNVSTEVTFNGVLIKEGNFKNALEALALKEGENSIEITSTDEAGNTATLKAREIVLDSTPPVIASQNTSDILTNVKNYTLNANFTDSSDIKYELWHNGVLIKDAYEKSLNELVALEEGRNDFVIKAKDLAGNQASDLNISNITLDTVLPVVSLNTDDDVLTNDPNFSIQASIDDLHFGDTIIEQNDVEVFKGSQEDILFEATLEEGSNLFKVKSVDLATNESLSQTLQNIVLNTSKPIISSQNTDNIVTTNETYTLKASIEDDLDTVTVIKHNGIEVFNGTSKEISTDVTLSGGANSFEIVSTDSAGNLSDPFELTDINFDNVAPVIASTTPEGFITNNKEFNLNATIEDVSNVITKISQSGQLIYEGDSKNISLPVVLKEGQNSFEIRSTDLAGNASDSYYIKDITLDTVDPVITSNTQDDIFTKDSLYTISASISDLSDVSYEISHNGKLIHSSNGSFLEYPLELVEGPNTLEISAIDVAGNISVPFELENLVLDTTSPVVTLATAPNQVLFDRTFEISGLVEDASSIDLEIYQNGELVFESTDKSISYQAQLENGNNDFTVVATDELGNVSEKAKLEEIYLDNVAPVIELAVSESELTKNADFTLQANIVDASATTTQIFHDESLIHTSNQKTISHSISLREGPNNFTLKTVDSLGNTATDKSFNVTLDSNSPIISFSPLAGTLINKENSNIAVSFSDNHEIDYKRLRVKLNGDLLESSKYSLDKSSGQINLDMLSQNVSTLFDRENVISVEIADGLNNLSVASSSYFVTRELGPDTEGPVISFNPPGGIVDAPLSSIKIGFSDQSDIDYQSLSVFINGIQVESNNVSINSTKNIATLNLSEANQSAGGQGLLIEVSIPDNLGNNSHAKVGINFISENDGLVAVISPHNTTSSSNTHTCVILENGNAKCWGRNLDGEVGIASPENNVGLDGEIDLVPEVNLNDKIISIKTVRARTCAITQEGSLYCWGSNTGSQLGYPRSQYYKIGKTQTPKSVGPVNIGEAVVDVALSSISTCALLTSGKVKCWGKNNDGILGLNSDDISYTYNNYDSPLEMPYVDIGEKVKQITAGYYYHCVILESGDIKCWGRNNVGQLGLGHTDNIGDDEHPSSTSSISFGSPAMQIDAGSDHTCTVLQNGEVKCWGERWSYKLGRNLSEHLGDDEEVSDIPSVNLGEKVLSVTAGGDHTCALLESEKVNCWGNNFNFQAGHPSGSSTYVEPIDLGPLDLGQPVKAVRAQQQSTCATLEDSSLKCWGKNEYSLSGVEYFQALGDDEAVTARESIQFNSTTEKLYANREMTCTQDTSNDVRCWGDVIPALHALNIPRPIGDNEPVTTVPNIPISFEYTKIAPSENHICALLSDGNIRCWGRNWSGELGIGYGNRKYGPDESEVINLGQKAIEVFTSSENTCALLESKDVKCWGRNNYGRLGLGHTNDIGDNETPLDVPVISLGKKVSKLTVGFSHNCAIFEDATARCWGSNSFGKLGLGHTDDIGDDELPSDSPILDLGDPIVQISTGLHHTCALLQTGDVKCWGLGNYGILGNQENQNIGDNETISTLAPIPLGEKATLIASGERHNCALLESGNVKCWGENSEGQAGIGNSIPPYRYIGDNESLNSIPNVTLSENAISLVAGSKHTCALLESGKVQCWGDNTKAQLGYQINSFIGDDEVLATMPPVNLGGDVIEPDPVGSDGMTPAVMAHYTPSYYYGQGPLEISFNALASGSTVGDIISYQWDFGDGSPISISTDPFATHLYSDQGVYSATLTVTDSEENTATYSRYITILGENILPISKLSSTSEESSGNLTVDFDGSESYDPGGEIVDYRFEFGDGLVVNGSEVHVSHIYQNPGHYSAKLIVTDNVGGKGVSEPVLLKIEPDPSAPIISSGTFGSIRTSDNVFNVKASIEDNEDVTVKVLHNGDEVYTSNSKSLDQNFDLFEGNNYFEIQATDSLGNAAIPLSIGYIILDTDLPIISSTKKSNTYTNEDVFSLDIQVTDSTRTTTEVYLNDELVTTSSLENFNVDLNLSLGSNKISVIATDELGSTSIPFELTNIVLDKTPPVLSNISPENGFISDSRDVEITGSSNEALKVVSVNNIEMNVDAAKKVFKKTLDAQRDGDFPFTIKAVDLAGNIQEVTRTTIVDTLPPVLATTNISGHLGGDSTYQINVDADDLSNTTTAIYQNGKKIHTTTDSNISFDASLEEGSNTFVVKSVDEFGNEVNPIHLSDIELDSTPPQIISNIASDVFTNMQQMDLSFNVIDNNLTTSKILLNGSEVFSSSNKDIKTSITLAEGNNNIALSSVDEVGNQATSVLIENIFLDQTPPVLSLDGASGDFNTSDVSYNINAQVDDEIETSTKFILNGELYSESNLKTFSESINLREGLNNIEVFSEDIAGNKGNLVSLRNIGLDTAAPIISSSATDTITHNDDFLLDIKIEDFSNTSTEVFLNEKGIYLSSKKDFNVPLTLKPGVNTISARSVDVFGHDSGVVPIATLTHDNSAPKIVLETTDDIYTNQEVFNLVANIEDSSNVLTEVYLNDNLVHVDDSKEINTNLTLNFGVNSIKLRAKEVDSNKAAFETLDNVVYDPTAPIITTSSPQDITTSNKAYNLNAEVQERYGAETVVSLNDEAVLTTKELSFDKTLFLNEGTNSIKIESADQAGNSATSVTLSNITYQTSNHISAVVGVDGSENFISDKSSSIYGAYVSIEENAVNEDVNLNVVEAELNDLPVIVGAPTPEPLGPVLDITVSETVDSTKTFNKQVVVGIPYSPLLALSENVNNENLTVVRYDKTKGTVEAIKPFKVDPQRGIAYALTNSFSYFFVASSKEYPKVAIDFPQNCMKLKEHYQCDMSSENLDVAGTFRLPGMISSNDVTIECEACSTAFNKTKNLLSSSNEDFVDFNLTGTSSGTTDSLSLLFRSGNLIVKERVSINYNVSPYVAPPESSLAENCFENGAICKNAGNESIGYTDDGLRVLDSALNLSLGNINRPHKFTLENAVSKNLGITYFISPKADFSPNYVVQDLINYKVNTFSLRKLNLDGSVETLKNFDLAIRASLTDFQDYSYNFNLEVQDDFIYLSLDSQNHLIDQQSGSVNVKDRSKILQIDRQTMELQDLTQSAPWHLASVTGVSVDAIGDLYFVATSFNDLSTDSTYKEGLFRYEPSINSWQYLTKEITNPLLTSSARVIEHSTDGQMLSNFDGRSIKSLKVLGRDIYFIDEAFNCIRRFEAEDNLSTLAGICHDLNGAHTEVIGSTQDAKNLVLSNIESFDVDESGSLYISRHDNDTLELSIVDFKTSILKKLTQKDSTGRLPVSSNESLNVDSLDIEIDQRIDSNLKIDSANSLYFYNNSCLYSVTNPYDYLFESFSDSTENQDDPLSSESLSESVLSTQSSDGYFNFDYANSSEASRVSDTLDALKLLDKTAQASSKSSDAAKLWFSNQRFDETSLEAKRLEALALLSAQSSDPSSAFSLELRETLSRFIENYRSEIGGWGSTKNHIVNNYDTANAIKAVSKVVNTVPEARIDLPIYVSEFIWDLRNICYNQFPSSESVFAGGFGPTNLQNMPTLEITLAVLDSLLEYSKINSTNDRLIQWSKKDDFNLLVTQDIPLAVTRAIPYIGSHKLPDGSYGSLSNTVKVINTLNEIIEAEIISDPALVASIDHDLMLALSFIKSQNLDSETKLELASLNLDTNSLGLSRSPASSDEQSGDTGDQDGDGDVQLSDSLFGDAKDGSLIESGIFNINVNGSNGRISADAASEPVSKVTKKYVYVDTLEEGSIIKGDEVLVVNLQGEESGNYRFANVLEVYHNESPKLIALDTNLEEEGVIWPENNKIMIQRVPHYNEISSNDTLTITANAFNGEVGGVVAFRVKGEITENVSIDTRGLGFRGGENSLIDGLAASSPGEGQLGVPGAVYFDQDLSCGGGAAVKDTLSGGGGAHGTLGEFSESHTLEAESGSIIGDQELSKIFLGCGGGSGLSFDGTEAIVNGGNGGGIAIVFAKALTFDQNTITSTGSSGALSGTQNISTLAGAGSGGSILLGVENLKVVNSHKVSACGGVAYSDGATQSGQDGGNGRVKVLIDQLNNDPVTSNHLDYLKTIIGDQSAFTEKLTK